MKNDKYIDVNDKRELLIWHAKVVLNSRLTGVEISKETGVNAQQVCLYRNGKRNIERAYLNNLLKFDRLYQTHDLFGIIRAMEERNGK
ncbi:hypothetical protein [Staphylococcus equorum]|uniref:Uncharacterized protein n=1 Tax=Staphylococcus equorum TaxID=246432 RepID=A0AAP7IFE0_9STAP|nr:hypothetical protein [Staphylococcus equorum]OEK58882.1 hypothetical protein ASS94_00745 [Staphylococcus equorum]